MERTALIQLRVKPVARDRLVALAAKLSTDEHTITMSDVARMAMAKGLPIVERELKA